MRYTMEKLQARRAERRRTHEACARSMKSALLEKGPPVFQKFGIRKVVLFGSVQRGRSTPSSDIDILVMPLNGERYWDFKHEIEEALDLPVDVHTPSDDPVFVEKLMQRGETIYES
jgi:predicted nucleotidyltransferase